MQDILRVVEEPTVAAVAERDTFTTQGGVVFRIRPVPPMLLMEARKRFSHKEPRVPKVYIEDKETHEDNPNDPDYIEAREQFLMEIAEVGNAVLLMRGTELISKPARVEGPDDVNWAQDLLETLELDIPPVGTRKRYLCWVKFVALATNRDYQGVVTAINEASGGTSEEEVAEAQASFRAGEGRVAAQPVPITEANGYRPNDSPGSHIARPGAGV